MGRVRRGRSSVFRSILDQQYDESSKYKLYRSVKGSQDWVQRLGLLKILPVHSGCVNCICWNEKGDSLLSGSDDQHLVISHAYNYKVLTNFKTSHKANIFSAKFLPCTGDTGIVSCSGDGMILYSDLSRLNETQNNIFNCHIGTTYEVQTIPNDPYVFLSCGEDTTVRSFDLRIKEKCIKTRCLDVCNEDVLISCQRAVTALTVNTVAPYQIAIGCSDSTVRLYDRRMLSRRAGNLANPVMSYKAPGMEGRSYRITSLSFSPHGEDILASYSSEHLYLFGVKNGETTTLTPEVTPPEPAMDTESLPGPVRRLRLRGDWSDTGPDARPQNYPPPVDLQDKKSYTSAENDQGLRLPRLNRQGGASQARPTLHGTLMQRMTDVLSRMLNDPATRAALSHGGEAFAESDPSSQVDPPPPAGSEGEEGDDDAGSNDMNVTRAGPLDLPLPSFSSSFTQSTPEDDDNSDHMDVEDQSPEDTPTPKPETTADAGMPEKSEETPSTSSSSTTATASTSTGSNNTGISPLNELSNMYHGFVEKTGVEPMVNLTYSDVGSTASCISVFVKRDKSTENTSQERANESDVSPSSESQGSQHSQEASDEEPNISQPEVEPSSDPEPHAAEEEALGVASENEVAPGITCRLFHMGGAMKNMPNTSSDKEEEPSNTRKSYFKQKYVGHRNARTMIKEATFWGDEYVVSGSDCGHVFMWQKESGKLEMLLEADHHVVNCVQPHPFLPILATSGIDYDVKLWAPVHNEPAFEQEIADELMKRNAVMLEETKDTITVPASFMIRMLACLNQLRRGGRSRQQRRDSNTNSD